MEKTQLNIIQCYAPINDKDEGTKYDFHNKLQTVLDKIKEKEVIILMGDFNAKIGSNNGYEEVMDTHGIGEMNENGEMFADRCSFNILIIGGSVFPHRRIHKATWISPDHRTENEINHKQIICINHKFRRLMQDVRVHRGADAASDHHLVLTKLKLELKSRVEKRKNRTRYNVEFLKDKERMETFRLTLSNTYDTLQDLLDEENMEVNPHLECLKKTRTSTCEEVLGKKKKQHKDWISVETINKLQVRKEKKAVLKHSRTRSTKTAAHEQYTVTNRAVKKSVKTDKVNFIESLAKEAEDAAARGNMKQLYDTTRKRAGKFKQAERPIKYNNGERSN